MTDPHDILTGPPRYLPTELADMLNGLLTRVEDPGLRRALRKWGEACFEAGYGLGFDDPTPEPDRRGGSTGYSYSTATLLPRPSPSPTYDALAQKAGLQ